MAEPQDPSVTRRHAGPKPDPSPAGWTVSQQVQAFAQGQRMPSAPPPPRVVDEQVRKFADSQRIHSSQGATSVLDANDLMTWLQNPNATLNDLVAASPNAQILTSNQRSVYAIPFDAQSSGGGGQTNTTVPLSEMYASLGRLNRDQLIRLQQQMAEAGMYPTDSNGQPTAVQWGALDAATKRAYGNMITAALLHPNQSLEDTLNDETGRSFKDLSSKRKSTRDAQVAALLQQTGNQLANRDDLIRTAQDAAKVAIGHTLSDSELNRFVDEFHAGQQDHIMKTINAALDKSGAAGSAASDKQADQFVSAIMSQVGQQGAQAGVNGLGMTPDEWKRYADRAGLGAETPDTPENERAVAKEIALNFAQQFNGSWSDVATAWFAGPGKRVPGLQAQIHNPYPMGSREAANYEAPQTPSINEMADRVTSAMRNGGVTDTSSSGAVTAADLNLQEGQADPQTAALNLIKREHPTEYGGEVMAARAKEFFDMMGATTQLTGKN